VFDTSSLFPRVRDQAAFDYLIPTFDTHRILSLKRTLTMPLRRVSQRLHPDEGLLQTFGLQQPCTQTLPTITEVAEPTFENFPEVQLQHATMSTTAAIASQSNEGDKHLNTNPLPPPSQVNQGEVEFNQIEVQDWD
jgi:hypothetical protein